jgi:ribosomal protein L11 methyltransferase
MSESWKLTLPCTRAEAEMLNGDVAELAMIEPAPVLMTEEPDESRPDEWLAHAYFEGRPPKATIARIQKLIPSAKRAKPLLQLLPDEDWITVSQQGIDPVIAGRFYVHTATNKGEVPPGSVCYQIDAGLAFGTGGHATTSGCLKLLDSMASAGMRFSSIADIGTGTGLLAFAALHLWRNARCTASDIDPVSVAVTAENAAINGVGAGRASGQIALCTASGTDHLLIQRRAPYDLLIANILAGPLIELAPSFADIMAEGGSLILAGLLLSQRDTVIATYAAQGLRLVEASDGEWPCLHLVKRRRYGWQRPRRASRRTTQPPGDFGTW